ncbi:MAG: flagellar basal body P-ring formation chaperone FlgA [Ignavibacteriaceae bacterium]|jgi:flagella basal body P-ring formation protein FlgA|nr:flagellar basal body P-ring formation chaperone FlgA [Ignavibacteriaceae bacterium]
MMLYLLNIVFLFSLNGNDFRNSLKEYLEKQLSMYDSFEYEVMQIPEDYSSIEIVNGQALKLDKNIVTVPVLLIKENKKRESRVTVKVRLYKNVATVINKVEGKRNLNSSDFELKSLDVSLLKGTPFYSLESINSFRTKIALNPGTILIRETLEEKPVIQSGDLVKASFVNGNVIVTMEANARQEGAVGEVIRVVTQNKKQYRAKVVDSSNVNIIE